MLDAGRVILFPGRVLVLAVFCSQHKPAVECINYEEKDMKLLNNRLILIKESIGNNKACVEVLTGKKFFLSKTKISDNW